MDSSNDLAAVWARLATVNSLTFEAESSNLETGWNGVGRGAVSVEEVDPNTMLFHEQGSWTTGGGKELAFTNVFRWTASSEWKSVKLEHLRFGKNHPLYLFGLTQRSEHVWESSDPHVCRDDLYTAVMNCGSEVLRLHWTITGPTKNESIRYSYS